MQSLIAAALTSLLALSPLNTETPVGEGSSPQIGVDTRGVVRIAFGRKDSIFVVTSTDTGRTFGTATLVGVVASMHLGNTRGPVIASSRNRTVILATDTHGRMTAFDLDHRTKRWTRDERPLNTVDGSAPEGLATIAADDADHFYATWLDLRDDRQTSIYMGTVSGPEAKRDENRLVYSSPDGHVCECCRPSIAVSGKQVAVMFRNWLGGARDMYVARSTNGGRSFAAPTKLGSGTWKLDACPMDGGALAIDGRGNVSTIWRREAGIYTAAGSRSETMVTEGRSPMMSVRGGQSYIVWQQGSMVMLRKPGGADETLAEGRLPQVAALADGSVLVAWERAGSVFYRRFPRGA